MILVVWLVVSLVWRRGRLPLAPARWALTAAAVLLAGAMRFFISFTTGLLAFWTTRATAIMELHAGVSLFLSGRLAPLALLPPAVAGAAAPSWFPYMLPLSVRTLTRAPPGPAGREGLARAPRPLAGWVRAHPL